MLIGGVIIGAGMQLNFGPTSIGQFTISRVLHADDTWVHLEGAMLPTPTSAWRAGTVWVRVDSLKRFLART